ncbi:NAD(P)-binding domain-containing protein [Paenibacillus sp. LHD-117]|uniref:NAD(P)-binding domain-containing protein n=1 Tax=Paenibacillus sp. LHD-117 TaxID=3071412 RepID=UPI0027E11DDA|nr:NAD(P)-binding domain-containing protein [Paenibacillus sp. LHD-117]MDQ6418362.1 NAD(P)-binding domain-containing protein [Paenibacillus sp. LHD-117]
MLDVIIIGAGPYGISVAAHAAARNLSYKLLGYPMDFWRNQMPQNMFIRTPHDLVSFSDPEGRFTIQNFSFETNIKLESPLPRSVFVQYAFWFAEKTSVEFTPELATSIRRNGDSYAVSTEGGQQLAAKHVVIATGIKDFQYVPSVFEGLPLKFVSHTLGYTSFEQFRGKDIIIVGSGQSAWEAAALLYEAKTNVQLIYRSKAPVYGGNRTQEVILRGVGNIFYKLPRLLKKKLLQVGSATVPIAHFLRPYVEGKVPQIGNASIDKAFVTDNKLHLQLSNGNVAAADHVIVASGFKIDLERLAFLDNSMKSDIVREEGYNQFPKLNRHFESNLKGLYFAGPLTSHSHGPTFRFILGLEKTAKTIINSI